MKKWITYSLLPFVFTQLFMVVHADSAANTCINDFKSHIINADTLWFDECKLTDKEIPTIISYLNSHHEITQLYLLNNNIGDEGALLLANNKTLKMLELRNNMIGSKGAYALAHSTIHMLDLQGNQFNSNRMVALAQNSASVSKLQGINKEVIILG